MGKAGEEREKRLAEALRENLKRRKAQARGDADLSNPPRDGEGDQPKAGGGGSEPRT
jgi:hypothetical protein